MNKVLRYFKVRRAIKRALRAHRYPGDTPPVIAAVKAARQIGGYGLYEAIHIVNRFRPSDHIGDRAIAPFWWWMV